MAPIRPLYIVPSSDQGIESGYLILRDGTTAAIRLARPGDLPALHRFIVRLSPESRRHRFFSASGPSDTDLTRMCDGSTPGSCLTLLVFRSQSDTPDVIAAGSYFRRDETTAEVALAVDDAYHGKGVGTLLVERLALLAVRAGFARLWAVTHADNLAMREVFRESGFEMHEHLEDGEMEVELSLVPTKATVARSEIRERIAASASLRPFFHPRSVAVIGASRDPSSIGSRLVEALVTNGFVGPVYPVNPYAASLRGLRAYPSVKHIPEAVDLAVIAVPPKVVLEVVPDCAAKGVRALVVITAGFAEVGEEGRRLQQRLVTMVQQAGMRIVGPNCFGIVNTDPHVRLNATFSSTFPPAGRVAMSSQSGALGLALLGAARRLNLGMSTFVSVGNKADVSGNDLLQYWEEDPQTDVILLYLESFGNPRRFARIARRVSARKPIVAVKAGRSQAGRRAAGSHTAALAGSDVAVEALFEQTGVIRSETLDDMFALATALSNQPLPKGRRVGIITNAGGPAILCADACESAGLLVPELSEQTKAHLMTFLPPTSAVNNPVDLIASATGEHYRRTITAVLSDAEIDALIVLYVSVNITDTTGIADGIMQGIRNTRATAKDKPVLLCWMVEGDCDRTFALDGETIPTYSLPETPARVLGKAVRYAEWRQRPPGVIVDFDDVDWQRARAVCTNAVARRNGGWLTTEETRRVLEAMKLPLVPVGIATTVDEAIQTAERVGFPVAIKLASHRIVHKTEVAGVHLNLEDASAVRHAFTAIRDRLATDGRLEAMEGVLVQPMIRGGVEVMVGMTHDPLFGPLVAFGLGGIHVEILGDVRFRIAPLTDRDAQEMIREIRGYRLLEGYRGHPPADIAALEEVLLRISRLVEEIHEIVELDLNPIFALAPGQGCRIVDARIRVGSIPDIT